MSDIPVRQSYQYRTYAYRRPAAMNRCQPDRHQVVIVGAGPVGLTAAIALAGLGVNAVLLDQDDTVSIGSRAICWAKRSLEILDRAGVAERMVAKGVVWRRGRVYRGDREIYDFDLLPEKDHKMPAFINLQQYHAETCLVDRLIELGKTEIRWRNRVTGVEQDDDGVLLAVETPDGSYRIRAAHVLAADGVHSAIRHAMGLHFSGRAFEERFLITDIRMDAPFPVERRFWFDPSFHDGQSALLHRQPDNVFRIDLQLGPDADPAEESRPERVVPRIRKIVGDACDFAIEWISVYSFSCRRMERFRHGRVCFLGDAAHVVSPFGARGGNGGLQDADNLAWKLAFVLKGDAPESLLDSYDDERIPAADENLLNAARSTDFMTPKTQVSADFREAALSLSQTVPFARALVNSGRLSLPHCYRTTPLSTPDRDDFSGLGPEPGAPAIDAPLIGATGPTWLLDQLGGRFVLILFANRPRLASATPGQLLSGPFTELVAALASVQPAIGCLLVTGHAAAGQDVLLDRKGLAFSRWGAVDGTAYLIRPDQHVAARWRRTIAINDIAAAVVRATARTGDRP